MIRLLIKSPLTVIGFAVVTYVFFFVPLGERTLFEHAKRIATTEEARELGAEAGQAARRLEDHLQNEVGRLIDGGADAGPDAGRPAR
ncbi:MAG: hypothetical protein AAGH15_07540 [Myxococcota bacterium]